jgi:putative membrane protein
MGYYDGFMGSYAWLGFILMFIFWIVVIWGLILLARRSSEVDAEKKSTTKENSALSILDKRYALGEINKQEYEEKKKNLLKNKNMETK